MTDRLDHDFEAPVGGGPGGAFGQPVEAAVDVLEVPTEPARDGEHLVSRGPTAIALARLRQDRGAIAGVVFLVLVVLMAIFAPLLVKLNGYPPNQINAKLLNDALGGVPLGSFGGISGHHWFGVEPGTGRDVFSRIAYGARISLGIGLASTVVTIFLGAVFGAVAGFYGGTWDLVISRVMDLLLTFPSLLFTIALIGIVPPSFPRALLIVLVLSGLSWPYIARVVRGLTLALREKEFVEAARLCGAKERRIVFKEILPNLTGPLLTYSALLVPGFVVAESFLSFLGVGVQAPTATWGGLLSDALNWYQVDPTYLLVPGLALFFTVFALNLLGDGVSSAFNPKSRR